MKVCQVLASAGEGGLENHVASLANSLADVPGLDVEVFAPECFADKLDKNVNFKPIDLTRHRYHPFMLYELAKQLGASRPDIVHAHANKAAAITALLKRHVPARYVATVHGSKRNTRVYSRFDHVIAVSKDVAATLQGVPTSVIYNGINSASKVDYSREQILKETVATGERPLAVAVGRLAPVKGFDVLLEAWSEVDADLLVVGDGPEKEKLRAMTSQLGMHDRVHFLGFRNDAVAVVAACDFLVISSHREGFPLVLVEALQAEVPVVSTNVSGAREILPEEVLSPVANAPALADCLHGFLALEAGRVKSLYEEPFRKAREELTLDYMTSRTADLYRSLLSSR